MTEQKNYFQKNDPSDVFGKLPAKATMTYIPSKQLTGSKYGGTKKYISDYHSGGKKIWCSM
jgi:hypothetical protein